MRIAVASSEWNSGGGLRVGIPGGVRLQPDGRNLTALYGSLNVK
jgi:hypothetical protein